jgi:MFS family permease
VAAATYGRMRRSRALDLLNFFIADVQTGFGPFLSVYLTTQKWTQGEIGIALSLATVTSLILQVPAGLLVDEVRGKRVLAAAGLVCVAAAAVLLVNWPVLIIVILAQVLRATGSSILSPAIAAISLAVVGHGHLGERFGRNARFASIGSAFAALIMGATGNYRSTATIFWLTALLCAPALGTLPFMRVRRRYLRRPQKEGAGIDWPGLRALFTDRRLLVFVGCVVMFHLANAAMLPVAAADVTRRMSSSADLVIAACIFVPQAVVALISPWVGRMAETGGRRPMMLLGWAALPLCGLLMATLPGKFLLIVAQSVSGVSGAVFGVMLPLIADDLTRETGHFTLCLGVLGVAVSAGAILSTTLAGGIADAAGAGTAIAVLAAAGFAGTILVVTAMPETAPGLAEEEEEEEA